MKEVGFNGGDVLSLSFVVSVAVIVIVGGGGAFCAFIAHCHNAMRRDLCIELDFNFFFVVSLSILRTPSLSSFFVPKATINKRLKINYSSLHLLRSVFFPSFCCVQWQWGGWAGVAPEFNVLCNFCLRVCVWVYDDDDDDDVRFQC